MKYLILLFLITQTALAKGEPPAWRQGEMPAAKTESCQWVDGFGAFLVVTSDSDWEKKWHTPGTPSFTQIDRLRRGEKAWVLIMFMNPQPDAHAAIDVTCDVKITRPNGKVTEKKGLEAMKAPLKGSANSMFLAKPFIGFVGEDSDPLGDWIVEVMVRDLNQERSVAVKTRFTLLEKKA